MLLKFSCKEFSRSLSLLNPSRKKPNKNLEEEYDEEKENSITFCKYNKLELENFLLQSNDYRALKKSVFIKIYHSCAVCILLL